MRRRSPRRHWSFFASLVVVGSMSGCGPTIDPGDGDRGSTSEAGGAEGIDGSSTQGGDTDAPSGACGEFDTELIGGGPPGPLGFPPGCSPNADPGVNGYRCCSDDPATADGMPPAYAGMDIPGGTAPLFSGVNNDLSRSGQCVRVGDLAGQGLIEANVSGCPIPCNPTWPDSVIGDVCGPARQCCQTQPLQSPDCIIDPSTDRWRPATGDDIVAGLTMWTPAEHATHQDPNGVGCLQLAGGDTNDERFLDCVTSLTVADQRGFCMALGAGESCPHAQPGYVDACEMLNEG